MVTVLSRLIWPPGFVLSRLPQGIEEEQNNIKTGITQYRPAWSGRTCMLQFIPTNPHTPRTTPTFELPTAYTFGDKNAQCRPNNPVVGFPVLLAASAAALWPADLHAALGPAARCLPAVPFLPLPLPGPLPPSLPPAGRDAVPWTSLSGCLLASVTLNASAACRALARCGTTTSGSLAILLLSMVLSRHSCLYICDLSLSPSVAVIQVAAL